MHDGHERVSATVGFNASDLPPRLPMSFFRRAGRARPSRSSAPHWCQSTCDRIGEVNRDSGIADRPSALA
jgi:hypothetical protein